MYFIGSERRKRTANGRQDGGHENVIGDRGIHWRGEGDLLECDCKMYSFAVEGDVYMMG